jgi:hypothetical protein
VHVIERDLIIVTVHPILHFPTRFLQDPQFTPQRFPHSTNTRTHIHKGEGCDLMFVACTEYLIILRKRTVCPVPPHTTQSIQDVTARDQLTRK